MTSEMQQGSLDKLLFKMWATKGCRFSAHARLTKLSFLSNLSISLVSFYIAAASVVSLIPSSSSLFGSDLLSITTCLASFLVIIISIFVSTADYSRLATEMYRCATEINKQYDALLMEIKFREIDSGRAQHHVNRYHEILSQYPINHSISDFSIFRLENKKEYGIEPRRNPTQYFSLIYIGYKPYFLYYFFIICPIIFTCIVVSNAVKPL